MKFQQGNKLARGGLRNPPGGRPSKEKTEIKKEAAVIAREYIEKHVKPILEVYTALAGGQVVERMTSEGKKEFILEVNPKTNMDAVGKLLPPAMRQYDVSVGVRVSKVDDYLQTNVAWNTAKDITPPKIDND